MTDLVSFGETMLRLSPPGDERVETADEYDVHVAGTESNVAIAAQRLGLDATWLSKVPDNPVGRRVTSELTQHGVTVDVVESPDGRLGTYYLEIGDVPRGNNVIYDRQNAAVTTATVDELPVDRVRDATAFHTTGITPGLSDTLFETTLDLLSIARDAGTTTTFDLNYRSKVWGPDEAKSALTELFPDVDVLFTAQRDARNVLDRDGDAEAIARGLQSDFDFDVIVITRGAEGALALVGDETFVQDTFPSTDAYPVGTGDSFVGGFLSQYVAGADVATSLEYGAATAAVKRSIPGDIAVLTPAEVESVIDGGTASISR
jgi:2-dehydro-3-deoxygluconokinase